MNLQKTNCNANVFTYSNANEFCLVEKITFEGQILLELLLTPYYNTSLKNEFSKIFGHTFTQHVYESHLYMFG